MTSTLSLHKQLQAIFDQHGKMTAQILLAEIEQPDHPMHDEIDWSDAKGHADIYRLAQARDIIRAHKMIYGELTPTASEPAGTTLPQREAPTPIVRRPVRTGPLMPGDPEPEDPPPGPLWRIGVVLLFVLAGIVLGAAGSWIGWW